MTRNSRRRGPWVPFTYFTCAIGAREELIGMERRVWGGGEDDEAEGVLAGKDVGAGC
jgi:hypothetical protein